MHTVDPSHAPRSREMIQAFVGHLVDLGRAESTIETYVDHLCRLDRAIPAGLAYACADELREAIYTPDRGPSTRAVCRAAVGQFFGWATTPEDPWLDYDPSRGLPRPKVHQRTPRPCTHEDLADILLRARDPYRLWYLLAAACGLRCVEISRLDRDDITETVVYLLGKGSKERAVPCHPEVWRAARQLPAGPIARRRDGKRATRRDVQMRGNRYLTRIGHAAVTMHRLRHWYGTWIYAASGNDLRTAQRLLGHTSPSTTQVYVDVAAGAATEAVRALPLPT